MSRTTWRFWSALAAAMTLLNYCAVAAEPCYDLSDPDARIAACTQAINSGKLTGPEQAIGYSNRGVAYRQKGDNDRAIADYNEAVRLNPKSALAYFARGRSYLFAGSVEKALADFNQASTQAPKNAYYVLWADVVGQRNHLPSRLAQTSS